MTVTAEDIARVAHEVNRAYCASLGDTSQPAWADAPDWQRQSALKGVSFHAYADHTPEQSHESWLEAKREDGWVYGPEKDENARTHPCMVAYGELPAPQRAKDFLFVGVVHAMRGLLVDAPETADAPEPQRAAPPAEPSDERLEDYLPPVGVLASVRDGEVSVQAAEDFFERREQEVVRGMLEQEQVREASLLDTFASMAQVQLGFKGIIDFELASIVMADTAEPGQSDQIGRLAWYCEAEGRLRYMKADAMLKARNIGR